MASLSSSAKVAALVELLERLRSRGEKVVVFTQFRRTLEALHGILTGHGFDAAIYHGS